MTTFENHEQSLRDIYGSSRFVNYVVFNPLKAHEFRNLTENDEILGMDNERLERMWLNPIQRRLQEEFRIDQRAYSSGTIPTLAELTEDFQVAAAITTDFMFENRDNVIGSQSVDGGGSRVWTTEIPSRARTILNRYSQPGGQVGRS